ncbi:MAG: ABC transporter permease [Gemmatimonadota bacterium]
MSFASPWNPRVRTIVRREYLERVRSRWFLFSTLVVPLLFLALSVLPVLLAGTLPVGRRAVVVVDATPEELGHELVERLRQAEVPAERLTQPGPGTLDLEALRAWVRAPRGGTETQDLGTGDASADDDREAEAGPSAWLYLGPDAVQSGEALLVEARELDPIARGALDAALDGAVRTARLEKAGIERPAIEDALRPTSLKRAPLRAEDGPSGFRTGLGLVFALVLYMMFMIYGQMIARGVLEEKTSDIVEILVSSARPWEMMLGKIVGIGAVGLTQAGIWAALLLGISALGIGSLDRPWPSSGSTPRPSPCPGS